MLGKITIFALTVKGLALVNRKDPDKVFEINNMSTKSFKTWKTLTKDNHNNKSNKEVHENTFYVPPRPSEKWGLCRVVKISIFKHIFLNRYNYFSTQTV